MRYSNKFNVLQAFWNISAPQFFSFGNTEKGGFRYLQSVDYQYLYCSQNNTVFTGKELDAETGYSYFGARYLENATLTLWLSVDPMADKYPSISPYAYCAWNPVKLVDPEGEEINPVFDVKGNYLGCTKEGYTGVIIISSQNNINYCKAVNEVKELVELSAEALLDCSAQSFDYLCEKNRISSDAQQKIFTHVASNLETTIVDIKTFSMSSIGGEILYYENPKGLNANFASDINNSRIYGGYHYDLYEMTVENIQCTIVYHEWYGHIIMKWGKKGDSLNKSKGGDHYLCYEAVINSPLFPYTTSRYQEFNRKSFDALSK